MEMLAFFSVHETPHKNFPLNQLVCQSRSPLNVVSFEYSLGLVYVFGLLLTNHCNSETGI